MDSASRCSHTGSLWETVDRRKYRRANTKIFHGYIGLATKWLRILSLGGNDKIRNHLVASPIVRKHLTWKTLTNILDVLEKLF